MQSHHECHVNFSFLLSKILQIEKFKRDSEKFYGPAELNISFLNKYLEILRRFILFARGLNDLIWLSIFYSSFLQFHLPRVTHRYNELF